MGPRLTPKRSAFSDDRDGVVEVGEMTGFTVLDVIGDWQADPGTAWAVAGDSSGTKDQTLVRKSPILTGNSNWTASAGTDSSDSEWVVNAQDDWTNLGFHRFSIAASSSDFALVLDCTHRVGSPCARIV